MEAKKHLAGGVNSPVRAFKAVGGEPIFMERAAGPFLYDIQGKKYIDYCLSWGAILLGHAEKSVIRSIQSQAAKGTSFGTATEYETALAKEIKKAFPGMERIRFTSSGTEAVMSAVRLARGVTQRSRIVKFEGCYHGHSDSLLVKAGSGLATFGSPDSAGVPQGLAKLTTVLPYNDEKAFRNFFMKHGGETACVLVEPMAGNMGLIPAKKEFLSALKAWTRKKKSLLIFDEVISGFRVCYGGAQHLYGIEPDITILGKIIGGGLPVGAFGAQKKIMDALSPSGRVYQAGTLSGNPLAMAAGLSVLRMLSEELYEKLNQKSALFFEKAKFIFKNKGKMSLQSAGSMFTLFFNPRPPQNFREAARSDQKKFRKFFHHMLDLGVYVPPSAFETSFISAAHGEDEFKKTLKACEKF